MSPLESKLRHMALGAGPTIECTQAADRIAELEKELEIASAFSHWVVIERDKLRIENAKLETEIKSLKDSLNRFIQCPQCGNKTVFTYLKMQQTLTGEL